MLNICIRLLGKIAECLRADSKPEAVAQTELIADDGGIGDARIWIVPLVGRESTD